MPKLKKFLYLLSITALVFNLGLIRLFLLTPSQGVFVTPLAQAVTCIQPGQIVINEIMQNPDAVSNGNGEWFEVYNPTANVLDLQGCVISDAGSDSHTIANSVPVPAYGYAVLGRNGDSSQNGGISPAYVYGSDITLANADDEVILTCCGLEIDRVEYDDGATFPDPTGKSMILASPFLDNNLGSNWCESSSFYGEGDKGTPGTQNDFCAGVEYCGNGIVEEDEECDDGNNLDGDGCSIQCLIEVPVCKGDVCTGLNRGIGGGTSPVVKAKWEMYKQGSSQCGSGTCGAGKDESSDPGAQFAPPKVWKGEMSYTVCAIATDPNGASDIAGVYTDIYYPIDRVMHKPGEDPDNPTGGCGAFIEQNTLIKLGKTEGYELFCNQVRNNNNNLPEFNGPFDYDEICAPDGELMKEEAFVWCDDKTLTWEDPAGDYQVQVFAQDKAGNSSNKLTHDFKYLEFTGYEIDFSKVDYGEVMLNTHKKIAGDRNFGTINKPTVRNIGNTRLNMKIAQDDMGLGKSSAVWNVEYDARVGSNESDWLVYSPFGYVGETPESGDYTELDEILDLSETEEMDFSILITKWPDKTEFVGEMWLAATVAPWETCD